MSKRIVNGIVYGPGETPPGILQRVKDFFKIVINLIVIFFSTLFYPNGAGGAAGRPQRIPGRGVIRYFKPPPNCGPGA